MANKRVSLKGKGADLFFGDYQPGSQLPHPEPGLTDESAITPLPSDHAVADPLISVSDVLVNTAEQPPRTTPPKRSRQPAGELASSPAGSLADDPTVVQSIRAVVKTPGREVSFIRMSLEEKDRLGDVIYAFKKRGLKITETDIARIAVNYILADYDTAGDDSVLSRLLASLRA